MFRTLHIGIIGCGQMGKIRARAMKKVPLRQTEMAISIIKISC